ncbi:MAG: radical SAM/SPASM domain-containing protein [Bacteriovoracaceae bacterium]
MMHRSYAPQFKKIYIEITNICNLQCTFCPEVERDKKVMGQDLFSKILQEVKPLTEEICLHLMGEPLSHPHFLEILKICEEREVKINLTSNGMLLKRYAQNLIESSCINQINFSLHSFFDNYPDKDITPYLETIFEFSQKFRGFVNYRLWNVADNKLTNDEIINKIESYFNVTLNRNVDVSWKKSKKILNKIYLHVDMPFTWPNLKNPNLGQSGFCYGLDSHIGIHSDGTVVPCCLDKEAIVNLGSIKEKSIKEILEGERAQKIVSGFKQFRAVEELCQRCTFKSRFDKKIK